jgi:hypothetical protein
VLKAQMEVEHAEESVAEAKAKSKHIRHINVGYFIDIHVGRLKV